MEGTGGGDWWRGLVEGAGREDWQRGGWWRGLVEGTGRGGW